MSRPRLLLLDEPSLGLAPLIVRQIFDAIKTLNRQDGLTVFLVEQNAFTLASSPIAAMSWSTADHDVGHRLDQRAPRPSALAPPTAIE
jgi:ABC-type molybdenum transport system ATPase subunit/photorepair protein PhrA